MRWWLRCWPLSTRGGGSRAALGKLGETFACQYLQRSLGWSIYATNWRCKSGELDIVAVDGDWLVVVEVKTRSNQAYGTPLEAVHLQKVRRLRRTVAEFLSGAAPALRRALDVRFDVIGLYVRKGTVTHVEHIRYAVEAV
jgi:putative endonuclease